MCNDGNACAQNDVCTNGACGGTSYTCAAPDQCHKAAMCNGDGTCSYANQPDGTTCNDGDACTQTDRCQGGVCTGGNPVACAWGCDPSSRAMCRASIGPSRKRFDEIERRVPPVRRHEASASPSGRCSVRCRRPWRVVCGNADGRGDVHHAVRRAARTGRDAARACGILQQLTGPRDSWRRLLARWVVCHYPVPEQHGSGRRYSWGSLTTTGTTSASTASGS